MTPVVERRVIMKSPARFFSMPYVLSLLLYVAAFFIINTDARTISGTVSAPQLVPKSSQNIGESSSDHSSIEITGLKRFDVFLPSDDSSNSGPYGVSSPFNLPPYDSLPPIPNTPPFCLNPPFTPQTPPSGNAGGGTGGDIPTPIVNPPPSPFTIFSPPDFQPNPPIIIPSPPGYFEPSPPSTIPSPTEPILSPPYSYEPSPPSYIPISPPVSSNIPSSPPSAFLPPVVYPPPAVPPPPRIVPPTALWCVAKPSVPDPIIQEAMNYACASGAYCDQIQPNGSCFQPNTLFAHASYAFNSYWQRTKVAGGTCEFGGTAMLVTVDPSYDGCQFIFY